MAHDSSRPSDPAWRQKVTGGKRHADAKRAWQKEADVSILPRPRWTRKTKILVGGGGLLGFVGLLIAVILWWWPAKPPTLILLGAGYEDNLAIPPNVYGWQGLHDLARWTKSLPTSSFWNTSGLPRLVHDDGPKRLTRKSDWDENLLQYRFKEKTVVIFFALHGGVDGGDPGGAYLLPHDADPTPNPKNRLRLSHILDTLANPGLRDKHKVLILDATQVAANWPFGMIHNDFARALRQLDGRIKDIPNLIVLSASDVDQRSWASPELRQTIFTHYVLEGLKGGAAPRGSSINALELFDYVKAKVTSWVRDNVAAEQTPVLLPTEGGRERAKAIKLTQVGQVYKAEESPEPASVDLKDLAEHWQTYKELSDRVPSPAVNAPLGWRRYQALLLRYEQLVMAGDKTTVGSLREELANLSETFRKPQEYLLTSLENTLPMPAALGVPFTGDEAALRDVWKNVWRTRTEADWPQMWKKTIPENKLARLRLLGLLLDEVVKDPTPDAIAQATKFVQFMIPAGQVRPAETHFLVMLQTYLRAKNEQRPPLADLREALAVNRLAEEVALALGTGDAAGSRAPFHPYSERVFAWIQDWVRKADQKRRWGQDLLFATDAASWEQARVYLKAAKEDYEQAAADAAVVRQAFQTRDQLMDELPSYSHLLAGRWVTRENQKEIDDRLKELEDLWKKVHRLHQALEKPNPQFLHPPAVAGQPAETLADLTNEIQKAFRPVQDEFEKYRKQLVTSSAEQPQHRREIDEVLAVFWNHPEDRRKLLESGRRLSRKLFDQHQLRAAGDVSAAGDPLLARLAGEQQGRMALAVLGKGWINRQTQGSDLEYDALIQAVRKPPDPDQWSRSFTHAGDLIGQHWRRLAEVISAHRDKALQPETTLPDALAELTAADQLCRQIDGALVDTRDGDAGVLCYRLNLHNLLVQLAYRTIADQWYADKPGATPYFEEAARKLAQDARDLVKVAGADAGKPNSRLAETDKLLKLLANPAKLELQGPASRSVTSEQHYTLSYQLVPGEGLPPGYPVLQMIQGAGMAFSPASVGKAGREVRSVGAVAALKNEAPVAYTFDHDPQAGQDPKVETDLTVQALYRGRLVPKKTDVTLYYRADTIVWQRPPPDYCGLAVRTEKAIETRFAPERGRMVIVLDCSGSMCAGPGVDANNFRARKQRNTKFDKAVDTLDKVLKQLDPGVTVSLWIFSNADAQNKDLGISRLRDPAPWDPAQRDGLMRQVRELVPRYDTPLIETMWKAKGDFPPDFKGLKTLVVLTDGSDSEFKKDPARFNAPDAPTFLDREFKNSGIQVTVVLFDASPQEVEDAKRDFQRIGQWRLPGHLLDAQKDTDKLFDYLHKAMHPRLYCRLFDYQGRAIPPEEGLLVTPAGERNPEWFPRRLAPSSYLAQVHSEFRQNIQMLPGDFLLLYLKQGPGGDPVFNRALYADEPVNRDQNSPKKPKGEWILTAPQNSTALLPRAKGKGLNVMLTLENQVKLAPRGDILMQIRPTFAWFELKGEKGARPIVKWGNLERYPAPAWEMIAENWPDRAPPVVSAWWTQSDLSAFRRDLLVRDPAKPLPQDFHVRRDDYQIESVTTEEHNIDGIPKPCLVVRARFAKDKPILVQSDTFKYRRPLAGKSFGYEHHYYHEAGKYMGIIYPVTEGDTGRPFTLDVIALDKFKAEAKDGGAAIEDWTLPEPKDRPAPPLVPERRAVAGE